MDLQRFKEVQRQVWSEGDYRPIGRLLEPAARILVDAAGATAGQRVLDVATGSGSVALLAAEAGAEVVGVDITDAWFDEARGRADAAGVQVEWLVGDAEDLPVDADRSTLCCRASGPSWRRVTTLSRPSWCVHAGRAAPSR